MDRPPVCFNFWTKAGTATSAGTPLNYDREEFNIGGGEYVGATSVSKKYVVKTAGTYLIGYSYKKRLAGQANEVDLTITRDGVDIKLLTTRNAQATGSSSSMYGITTAVLQVDDLLFIKNIAGNPRANDVQFTEDNVKKTSFWGIRLNYT
jgi:hypothetical protein